MPHCPMSPSPSNSPSTWGATKDTKGDRVLKFGFEDSDIMGSEVGCV